MKEKLPFAALLIFVLCGTIVWTTIALRNNPAMGPTMEPMVEDSATSNPKDDELYYQGIEIDFFDVINKLSKENEVEEDKIEESPAHISRMPEGKISELLENCFPDVVTSMDYHIDASVFTRDDENEFGLCMQVDEEFDEFTKHQKANIGIAGSGLKFDLPMERYIEKTKNIQYVYSKDSLWGTWTVNEKALEENNKIAWIDIIKTGNNFAMTEDNDYYIITGCFEYESFITVFFDMVGRTGSGAFDLKKIFLSSSSEMKDIISFYLTLEKTNGALKQIAIRLDKNDEPTFNSIEVLVTINGVNNVDVTIPEAIKQSAIHEEAHEFDAIIN